MSKFIVHRVKWVKFTDFNQQQCYKNVSEMNN